MRIRGIVAVLATAGGALSVHGAASAGTETPVVFTVGIRQDIDNFNVTVGVTVTDYEAWTLHYPTLTGKAAADFAVTPALAEKWEGSADGLTWTYTLRSNVTWSDGEPLTADDVAYTINRSRDEEWQNHISTVANLTAEATDATTLVVTSSAPDPKLPSLDVFIVPQHIYEKVSADDLAAHDATKDPGGGPFVLTELKNGQFWRMKANDSFYGGRPEVDEVIFTLFTDDDAMVGALETGEVDALGVVPASQFDKLAANPDVFAAEGEQGSFAELGLNAGMGLDNGHPSLKDVKVRTAIAYAVDRQTLIDKALNGHGKPATTITPSADPKYNLGPELLQPFDLATANKMLDDAGYADADGDGVREMPGGGNPLRYRYFARSESEYGAAVAEFITGWMREIGIAVDVSVISDSELTTVIGSGEYEMFVWAWTPFVDPDAMLSYFTCDQLSKDPDDPTNYYNDASWCDPRYDELYAQQNAELDPAKRAAAIEEMLTIFHEGAAYVVLFQDSELNAIRIDRWTGIPCQPEETGPFLFNNTAPIYTALRPRADAEPLTVACGSRGPTGAADRPASGSSNGDDDGSSLPLILALLGAVVVVAAGAVLLRKRRTSDDRE
jgi:peptide/nickel transport system substrate-binding protein